MCNVIVFAYIHRHPTQCCSWYVRLHHQVVRVPGNGWCFYEAVRRFFGLPERSLKELSLALLILRVRAHRSVYIVDPDRDEVAKVEGVFSNAVYHAARAEIHHPWLGHWLDLMHAIAITGDLSAEHRFADSSTLQAFAQVLGVKVLIVSKNDAGVFRLLEFPEGCEAKHPVNYDNYLIKLLHSKESMPWFLLPLCIDIPLVISLYIYIVS